MATTIEVPPSPVAHGRALTLLREPEPSVGELWRHLIATAILADATAWGTAEQSEAFTASLLHDIGRMVMATQGPARYARVVQAARAGADPIAAERSTFGLSHLAWGEAVAAAGGSQARSRRRSPITTQGSGAGSVGWYAWGGRSQLRSGSATASAAPSPIRETPSRSRSQ